MNNLDHISKSFKNQFFGLKYFDLDPGSGMEKSRIRDKHPGIRNTGALAQNPEPQSQSNFTE
jgi:hypothetical protein